MTTFLFIQEQIRLMQEEHKRSLDMLQHHLDQAENDNIRLRTELDNMPASHHQSVKKESSEVIEYIRDPRQEERQQGEVCH